MIESLRKKQVKIQAQREEEILQKIKQKMDRIKANQQKLQPALLAPKTHYQGKWIVLFNVDEKKESLELKIAIEKNNNQLR